MRSSITISLVKEARGGPFVFWDDLAESCQKAWQHGFIGVEIFPPSADAIAPDVVRPILQQRRLQLAAVGSGGGKLLHGLTLTSGDPSVRQRAKEFVRSLIDAAGAMSAPVIVGSMQRSEEHTSELQSQSN